MSGEYNSLLVFILSLSVTGLVAATSQQTTAPPSIPPDQRNKAIAAFESSLLKLFGLSQRPSPSRDIVVPQYMIDLYRARTGSDEDIPNIFTSGRGAHPSNTVRSFYHKDVEHLHGCSERNCARIWFNVTYIPREEALTAAELRVYVERNQTDEMENGNVLRHKLQVFEIMKPVSTDAEPVSRLIDVQDVVVQNSTWLSFDVHPAVLKWKNKPRNNHGLEVRLVPYKNSPSNSSPSKHVRLRRSATDVSESEWDLQKPLLVTYTDDGKTSTSRTKKSVKSKKKRKRKNKRDRKGRKKCPKGKKGRQCRKDRKDRKNKNKQDKKNPPGKRRKGHKNLCGRKPLYVDFSDVGWNDWIVAPLGYQAYYCAGNCPFPLADNMNTTNHAIVQTLVNSVDPRAAPTACCVPTTLSSISILYLDEYDKVVLKEYGDMVVEGCGCR